VALTYAEWRRLLRVEGKRVKNLGFKDDPAKDANDILRLEVEVQPKWIPGRRMHLAQTAITEVVP